MLMNVLALMAGAITAPLSEPFDFSRSYVVWAASINGRCNFYVTDVGENARQLVDTLREQYPTSAGIEILTDDDTPVRCAIIGVKAARKAGFKHVRIRLGTDKDRMHGIP